MEVVQRFFNITFHDGAMIALKRTNINVEEFARWLADRGASAARDFKWEP